MCSNQHQSLEGCITSAISKPILKLYANNDAGTNPQPMAAALLSKADEPS